MLSAFRTFAKSWVAAILIGLLIVAFAVFGITDFAGSGVGGDNVVVVGDREISSAEFRQTYDAAKRRMEEQSGQSISHELAEANQLDRFVLNEVAQAEAFGEYMTRIGVRPSDKLLVNRIEQIPAFFDPITGRFDRDTFEQRLTQAGQTPEMFDRRLRDEIATQHWASGVADGLRAPRAYGALAASYAMETRDIAFFTITPRDVPQPPAPTDAQLTAFIKENAAQLTRPEMRVLTVVPFAPPPDAAAGAIDEAELEKRYEFRKDTLSSPETRTLMQIPAKDAAAAKQIAERLTRGEAPAAVAKAFGVDAITYEDKPRTAIADRRVAEAAFAMQAGQVGPVQGELGQSVVKVVSVTPGREVTLEEARPMLEAEIRQDMVAEKVYAMTQVYDDARQSGASVSDAAVKAGAPVVTVGPVSRQGQGLTLQQQPALSAQILETAFDLPAGGESDVVEAGEGQYFAVRVEKVLPPALPPLQEVRPQLAQAWTARELDRAMDARATELAARIRKGEKLEQVGASAGYEVTRLSSVSRQAAGQNPESAREVLMRAFGAKPGDVFTATTPQFTRIVGRVSNVRLEENPMVAAFAEAQRPQMTQDIFREMAQAAQAHARREMKVRVYPERARAAVGFEPLEPAGKTAPKT